MKKLLTKKEWTTEIKPFLKSMGGFEFENDFIKTEKSSYRDYETIEFKEWNILRNYNEDEKIIDNIIIDASDYNYIIEKLKMHLKNYNLKVII